MQQKFIDHEDYDHLISTLFGDFHKLLNKIKQIEKRIKVFTGGINKKNILDESEVWESPLSKNKWTIYYCLFKKGKNIDIHFYPYIEFHTTSGEKVYLLISKETRFKISGSRLTKSTGLKYDKNNKQDFKDFLLKHNWVINIFRGHFLHSFRDTIHNSEFTAYRIIYENAANKKYRLVKNFVQNQKWLLFLHKWGVAMVKEFDNYLLFETYIGFNELKVDQLDAIKIHLLKLSDEDYLATTFYLIEGPCWRKFIDKDRFQTIIDKVKGMNPEFGNKLETGIINYWKNYLL